MKPYNCIPEKRKFRGYYGFGSAAGSASASPLVNAVTFEGVDQSSSNFIRALLPPRSRTSSKMGVAEFQNWRPSWILSIISPHFGWPISQRLLHGFLCNLAGW